MMPAPRSLDEVFRWYHHEREHPSRSWKGLCQMSVRMAWGLPAVYGSAWAQWLGAKAAGDAHGIGGNVTDAPLGAALCYKGSGPYGHIVTASARLGDTPACWSNDLIRDGKLDRASRTLPTSKWGQKYLGWIDAVSGYELNLKKTSEPPKPKHGPKRYKAIAAAISNMERAHETAVNQNDTEDIAVLDAEIDRLKAMHDRLRKNDA